MSPARDCGWRPAPHSPPDRGKRHDDALCRQTGAVGENHGLRGRADHTHPGADLAAETGEKGAERPIHQRREPHTGPPDGGGGAGPEDSLPVDERANRRTHSVGPVIAGGEDDQVPEAVDGAVALPVIAKPVPKGHVVQLLPPRLGERTQRHQRARDRRLLPCGQKWISAE